MKKYSMETTVGIFVFIGLLCTGYLTVKLGKMELVGGNFYSLTASFDSVAGLKHDSSIQIAGVEVGRTGKIFYDPVEQRAVVELKIKKGVPIQDDCIASVRTSGLIGDKYISILPGGSEELLHDGDVITDTEPAIDIEALLGKYVFGSVDKQ
jgi:phospholipid/cholesterol/gamma-HCH transport system substrate-binding protein